MCYDALFFANAEYKDENTCFSPQWSWTLKKRKEGSGEGYWFISADIECVVKGEGGIIVRFAAFLHPSIHPPRSLLPSLNPYFSYPPSSSPFLLPSFLLSYLPSAPFRLTGTLQWTFINHTLFLTQSPTQFSLSTIILAFVSWHPSPILCCMQHILGRRHGVSIAPISNYFHHMLFSAFHNTEVQKQSLTWTVDLLFLF
jgi:hypothetical protein